MLSHYLDVSHFALDSSTLDFSLLFLVGICDKQSSFLSSLLKCCLERDNICEDHSVK